MIKKDTLLAELTDFDIEEIYQDALLNKQGFEFYYITDADEIVTYCSPFGTKKKKRVIFKLCV